MANNKRTTLTSSVNTDFSQPLTVGQLTGMIKTVLETGFSQVSVIGEISNLTQHGSGHCYLTLKDSEAQLPAVIWKSVVSRLKYELRNGIEFICRGRIELYAPYGRYQLTITQIEPKGVGALELAFRQLHEKLSAQGLFLPSAKKAIPKHIQRIGLITSPTGAAIRDFLNVLGRRTKRVEVVILPVKVQGEGAAKTIAAALELANQHWTAPPFDCLALIRGGGSAEDLWSFNEEVAVRAVAASRIPVVTGIGHEIDVSLCDLAADLHALTPSDVAARLVADDADLVTHLSDTESRLHRAIDRMIDHYQQRLRQLDSSRLFVSPEEPLLGNRKFLLDRIQSDLNHSIDRQLERATAQTTAYTAKLESLSPLSVLARGYSLTQKTDGQIVHTAKQLVPGETIVTRLAEGTVESIVQ